MFYKKIFFCVTFSILSSNLLAFPVNFDRHLSATQINPEQQELNLKKAKLNDQIDYLQVILKLYEFRLTALKSSYSAAQCSPVFQEKIKDHFEPKIDSLQRTYDETFKEYAQLFNQKKELDKKRVEKKAIV